MRQRTTEPDCEDALRENTHKRPASMKTPDATPQPIMVVPNSPKTGAAIEAAIRKAAGKPTGELSKVDLENVTSLDLDSSQITDLTPLMVLTKLVEFSLNRNQITELKPMAELTELKELLLARNKITDVTPIAALTNLELLVIGDIKPLIGLIGLTVLSLFDNQIKDMTPLVGMANLERLPLHDTNLSKAEIGILQQELPNCSITHNTTM